VFRAECVAVTSDRDRVVPGRDVAEGELAGFVRGGPGSAPRVWAEDDECFVHGRAVVVHHDPTDGVSVVLFLPGRGEREEEEQP
jgi:hypothetical protein